jgi:hypothetical protein
MIKSDFNKNIAIAIIFVVCIFFLWKSGIIYSHSLFPIVKEGRLHIFADWAWVIKNGICINSGFDIFNSHDACPLFGKDNFIFNIGNILLYIPYFKFLEKFYFFYFPLMLCSIFIYITTKLVGRKNFPNIVLLILTVFSPQVLLVLERCNVDLIIFLLLIIMVKVNQPLLSFSIINFVTLLKYYPAALITNFVVERKRSLNKNIFIILIFFSTLTCLMYLSGESFDLIRYKLNAVLPTWGNQFSLHSFAILLSKFKKYDFNTILIITLSIFIILSFSFYKYFQNILKNIELDENNFKYRLYIVGSNLIIAVYLITQNIHYREIFLIALFPLILELKDNKKIIFFKYFVLFIILRLIIFYFTNYYVFFEKIYNLLYIKAFLDIVMMSIFFGLTIFFNLKLIKKLFNYRS